MKRKIAKNEKVGGAGNYWRKIVRPYISHSDFN
jgi:hypothetical protein